MSHDARYSLLAARCSLLDAECWMLDNNIDLPGSQSNSVFKERTSRSSKVHSGGWGIENRESSIEYRVGGRAGNKGNSNNLFPYNSGALGHSGSEGRYKGQKTDEKQSCSQAAATAYHADLRRFGFDSLHRLWRR
jgi:hypothetical protein